MRRYVLKTGWLMIELLRREFVVRVPLNEAWDRLAEVEKWPEWAMHIRRIGVSPSGPLGGKTAGTIHLRNGIRSTFVMTAFDPPRRWTWQGKFLWLSVRYDHLFEAIDSAGTRLIWIVEGNGFLVSVLGPLFARIYVRNLDKAIPRCITWIEESQLNSDAIMPVC